MSTGLETLGSDLLAYAADVVREDGIARPMKAFQDGWNAMVPVAKGTFRASLIPWCGAESSLVPAAAPMPPLGHDAIDRALEGFQLGQRAGFTERQPYTGFLLAGGSPQAPDLEAALDTLVTEIVL